jgi:RNA polymerase sigma factor (sigma-70 family)
MADLVPSFYASHLAWYSNALRRVGQGQPEIMVCNSDPGGGVEFEFAIRWYDLGGKSTMRVEVFSDALAAFVQQWPNPLAAMYRTCAKQYGAMRKVGISNDEMMSLAFTGWLRAVAAYDPGRGSFMTLATFWARSTFRDAIRERLQEPREVSLDAEYNDAKLTEFLADQRDDYREYERCEAMPVEAEKVREALVWLDHRELLAAEVYYGIDREPGLLRDIGALLGVSRERGRNIKDDALNELRKDSVLQALCC